MEYYDPVGINAPPHGEACLLTYRVELQTLDI